MGLWARCWPGYLWYHLPLAQRQVLTPSLLHDSMSFQAIIFHFQLVSVCLSVTFPCRSIVGSMTLTSSYLPAKRLWRQP